MVVVWGAAVGIVGVRFGRGEDGIGVGPWWGRGESAYVYGRCSIGRHPWDLHVWALAAHERILLPLINCSSNGAVEWFNSCTTHDLVVATEYRGATISRKMHSGRLRPPTIQVFHAPVLLMYPSNHSRRWSKKLHPWDLFLGSWYCTGAVICY